jgi:release factor glutamine methyltransferase
VLDLGTGTGALLLALLKEFPASTGVGVDLSEGALTAARTNAASHGLADRAAFAGGDWTQPVRGPFDLIVSNPPYIATGDLAGLPRDVRDYDPHAALDGGADGLEAYRAVLPALAGLLAPDGLAIFEIGVGQRDAVAEIAEKYRLRAAGCRADLAGIDRAVSFRPVL